ncbi:MAG: hypothetical protein SPK30_02555 [Candidatus Cryptobacteroides sp.]|nr:hypothetical protein [Bacteroidales bacterium]MDY5743527.1 hypothetical protein [Candidatus Cryptobacteroides sp.]
MKKILFCAFLMLAAGFSAAAGLVERTYVCTDRHSYVAGEDVFCSVFCFDGGSGSLSDFSSVAYVELISPEGSAVRVKMALQDGRGAGRLRLPSTLPTGNYRLIAYTALNRNEEDMDYFRGSRVISVYNTLSASRQDSVVPDGDAAVEGKGRPYGAAAPAGLELEQRGDSLFLRNSGTECLDFCLSLSISDALPDPEGPGLADFLEARSGDRTTLRTDAKLSIPEYEGEIVSIRVPAMYSGVTAVLSGPGLRNDIYSSTVDSTGLVSFYTGNIYGDRDLVFELNSRDVNDDFSLEVLSPFASPELDRDGVPELHLNGSVAEDLKRRSVAMQISRHFGIDEYMDSLQLRPDLLFKGGTMTVYEMDDYTRFPTMRETIVEYVREVHIRRQDGEPVLKIVPGKSFESYSSMLGGNALVLVDGVPVSEHGRVLDLNPALLRRICIYPYDVSTGSCIYSGVVNFISFRGDMAGLQFPGRVRILDFHGVTFPVTVGAAEEDSLSPDYRYTRIWQPLLHLEAGEELALPLGKCGAEELRLELEGVVGRSVAFSTAALLKN